MSRVSQLKDLLPKAIGRAGITRQFAATGICQLFRKTILKADKKIAAHCQPLHYRNHILYVKCDGAVWAQELQMMSYLIIEEINEKLRKNILERIQIKI